MEEQKIKKDGIYIGANICAISKQRKIGQKELVSLLQLQGVEITRKYTQYDTVVFKIVLTHLLKAFIINI